MIEYGTGKIISKVPPFWQLNEENQELQIQSICYTLAATEMCLFAFLYSIEFPALKAPPSKLKRCSKFKIIFPIP